MGSRSKSLVSEDPLIKKMLLKKLCRMRKMLRTLKLNNSSLKSRNKELILTIQELKECLRESEKKLRSMNISLCEVNAKKNTYQQSFNKLAGQMLELTMALQGSTSLVTKIVGTITETAINASGSEHTANIEQMAEHCQSMKQTTGSAVELTGALKELTTNSSSCATEDTEDVSPGPSGEVPTSNESGNKCMNSESSRKWVNIAENVYINPPAQPCNYRLPTFQALSPVVEQSSQVTPDASGRLSPIEPGSPSGATSDESGSCSMEPGSSSDATNSLQEDSSVSNCVVESSTLTDENDEADPDAEDSVEYFNEPLEQKPIIQEIEQKPLAVNLSGSFQNSLGISTSIKNEALRDRVESGSLTLQAEDPGIPEMSSVLCQSSGNNDMKFPFKITITHQVQNSSTDASPSYSISSIIVDKNTPSPNSNPFQNVFPRRKKPLPELRFEDESSCPSTPGTKRKKTEESLSDTPGTSQISLRSHSTPSIRRSPRYKSSSPSKRESQRNTPHNKNSPKVSRSNKNSPRASTSNKSSPRASTSYKSSPRASTNIKRSLKASVHRSSSNSRTSSHKQSPKRRSSSRLSLPKTGNNSSLLEGGTRRTRKVIKCYKEPNLNTKLRR